MTRAHRIFAMGTLLSSALLAMFLTPLLASVGLEEWHVETPGKNLVGHFDPFAEHGTVIISREKDVPKLHVKRIERWLYYRGYVAGEADHQFFLFNENTKEIKQFESEQLLTDAVNQLKLGRAKSKWLTAKDGWEKNWGKVKNSKVKPDKIGSQTKNTDKTD